MSCSISPLAGSGRSEFSAARATSTGVVEVNALRFTSDNGTPNSIARTMEFGLPGSGGPSMNRTRSPAVEVLSSGRTPLGLPRKLVKSREARYSVKELKFLGKRGALTLNSRHRCKPRFQV